MGHRFKGTPRRSPGVAEGRTGPWAFIRRLPWYRFAAGAPAGGARLLVSVVLCVVGRGVFLPRVAGALLVRRGPGGVCALFLPRPWQSAAILAPPPALVVLLPLP